MTTANKDFSDLMPHRIEVTGDSDIEGYDDQGRALNSAPPRTYICLLDDTETVERKADGAEVTVAFTAYVAPVPLGSLDGQPVDIKDTDKVVVIEPDYGEMEVKSIERHWDAENGIGMLHNIVLRFG